MASRRILQGRGSMENIPGEHPFLYMYAPVEQPLICAYQGAKKKKMLATVFSHLQTS